MADTKKKPLHNLSLKNIAKKRSGMPKEAYKPSKPTSVAAPRG